MPQLDGKGYLLDLETGIVPTEETDVRRLAHFNAIRTISADELSLALDHLGGGAGSELRASPGKRPKFLAAYSSSALALNCFAPFLGPRRLALEGHSLERPQLETILKIGHGCGRPNLDLLDSSSDRVLAIESKCTEYLKTKKAVTHSDFAWLKARDRGDPYERRTRELAAGDGAIQLHSMLTRDPLAFRHLDATQLLKHYLGLRNEFDGRSCTLIYLYWEPDNATAIKACREHDNEIARLEPLLSDPCVRFRPMTYSTLRSEWLSDGDAFLRDHAAAVAERYSVNV